MTACPSCGGVLRDAGTTTSETLDWVPASVRVVRINRPKCACRACGTLHQAPAPERIVVGCLATPGLIAHVLTSRYCDHLPLYRQSQMLARQGVTLARSTLADWVKAAACWLAPLRDQLMNHVCAAERVFADDTPLPILDPGRNSPSGGVLVAHAPQVL
ncbi:IS66 family transposase [Gluconobacter wancherniae]|uniref:IS66 family transposase n=1 Tax=Gluconobacter wancherniae TaxID=1307955 RepID=UPI0038CF2F55